MRADYFKHEDRTLGMAVIGKTGFGKSAFLENLIRRDIREGGKVVVVDPHGDLAESVLSFYAANGSSTLTPLVFPAKATYRLMGSSRPGLSEGLNLYECPQPLDPVALDRAVDNVVQVFKKLWGNENTFYPRIEYVLRNTARVIASNPGATMADIPLLFHNLAHRKRLLRNVENLGVHQFFAEYDERPLSKKLELIESTTNKLDQFLGSESLYQTVRSPVTTLPIREFLDHDGGALMVISLPIGVLGEGVAEFLGAVFLSVFQQAILARTLRNRVSLYIDEYHRFATPAVTSLLTEGRKFNLATTVAVQTLEQVREGRDRTAVLSAGSLVSFQVEGKRDADTLAAQMRITPRQTDVEPRPVMRTEPTYKTEWEWDSPESETQYEKAEQANAAAWQARSQAQDLFRDGLIPEARLEQIHQQAEEAEHHLYTYWGRFREQHYRPRQVYVGSVPAPQSPDGRLYDLVPQMQSMAEAKAELVNVLATLPRFTAFIQLPDGTQEKVECVKPPPVNTHYGQVLKLIEESENAYCALEPEEHIEQEPQQPLVGRFGELPNF